MNEEVVKLTPEEEVVIEVTETVGWAAGDATLHNSLGGRDAEDQHPIKSIIGLRAELDEIEKLKTVYSDKLDTATYYAWNGNSYGDGYFVSLVPKTSTITLCNGESSIFGVTVSEAGFVGGQDADTPRDDSYALVVTSGLVDVRCVDSVAPGDYVVAGEDGMAHKVECEYHGGYKVVAIDTKGSVKYASIALGVQADVTNVLAINIENLNKRLEAAEANIIIANNRADDAYDKAVDAEGTSSDASGKADSAIGAVDKNTQDINEAKKIANDAMSYAETYCDDAIKTANEAWAKKYQGLQDNEYSLRVNIDDYSVGECSQAYGLTLEQATSILETGMIYVPTIEHEEKYPYTNKIEVVDEVPSDIDSSVVYYVDSGDDHGYWYTENDALQKSSEMPAYSRIFRPGYLYQWSSLSNGKYGWITIDKDYKPTDINTSSEAVYFMQNEPTVAGGFGYWYTDGDEIKDKNNRTGVYQPYALYKWDIPENGDTYSWVLVATRAANTLNRTVGITNLTANEAAFSVYNARGSIASMNARLTETEAKVSNIAIWENVDGSCNLGAIDVSANKDGSQIVLAVKKNDNEEPIQYAGLVLKQDEDGSSYISLDAADISINGNTIFTDPDSTGETKISGGMIETEGMIIGGWTVRNNGLYAGNDINYYISFGSDEMFNSNGLWLYSGSSNFSVSMDPASVGTLDFSAFNSKSYVGLNINDDEHGILRGKWRNCDTLDFTQSYYGDYEPGLIINYEGINITDSDERARTEISRYGFNSVIGNVVDGCYIRLLTTEDGYLDVKMVNAMRNVGFEIPSDKSYGSLIGNWNVSGTLSADDINADETISADTVNANTINTVGGLTANAIEVTRGITASSLDVNSIYADDIYDRDGNSMSYMRLCVDKLYEQLNLEKPQVPW